MSVSYWTLWNFWGDNPRLGRAITDDKRELIAKGYVIPYLIDKDAIKLLGIYKANEWQA